MSEQYPEPWNTPEPPESTLWDDQLRWCVFVMNRHDPQRHFAASCLTWVLKAGGLTERQSAACTKMLARIRGLWAVGALDCQAIEETTGAETPARKDMH